MKPLIILLGVSLLLSAGGCHYYQEYRGLKGDADLKDERARSEEHTSELQSH